MTKREYSPEEIKEIHQLVGYTGEELRKQISLLAMRYRKPFECIKKRLEYEIKNGNIKQTQMKQIRFSPNDEERILELKFCRTERERKEKCRKLAAELGYEYSQIRWKYWYMQNAIKKSKNALKVPTTKITPPKVEAVGVIANNFAVEIPLSSFNFEVINGKLRYWPKV